MLMMLPFEAPTIFESIHKSYFRMPRVVKDQRSRFESDDLFRQLSHESAVKYIGFKDRPLEERQMKFIANCQEGHTEVSVVQSGSQFTLMFNPTINPAYNHEGCDFDKEPGKVHIKAGFILNGVCVLWHGWIDLQRLEGFGCVEFDEYRAYLEDAMAKQSNEKQKSHITPTGLGLAGQPAPVPSLAATSVAGLIAPPLHTAPLSHYAAVPPPPPPPMPPVSLADPAVQHYGNATLAAAAAAAAFHQAALAIGGAGSGPPQQQPPPPPTQPPLPSQAPSSQQPPALAQAQQQAPPPPQAPSLPLGLAGLAPGSPHSSSIFNSIAGGGQHRRQATKRAPEELTQTEEVDVVSDIDVHELDIPPRRKFKSDQLKSAASSIQSHNHHNNHHNHHHHHHQAASVWTKQTQESSLRSERSR